MIVQKVASKTGRRFGDRHPRTKVGQRSVRAMRKAYAAAEKAGFAHGERKALLESFAARYDVHLRTVKKIVYGETRTLGA